MHVVDRSKGRRRVNLGSQKGEVGTDSRGWTPANPQIMRQPPSSEAGHARKGRLVQTHVVDRGKGRRPVGHSCQKGETPPQRLRLPHLRRQVTLTQVR